MNLNFSKLDGLLPAIILLLLPFAILWVLVKVLPPWEEPSQEPKAETVAA